MLSVKRMNNYNLYSLEENMQKKLTPFLILVFISLIASACGPQVQAAQGEPVSASEERTMSVNGTGRIFLSPDIGYIAIGVHTENDDAAEAVADNNAQSQRVAAALDGYNIPPEDIQTQNFSIYPQQKYNIDGEPTNTTYVVDNTVFVTVRDLDQIGEILNDVIDAGANSINNIQFDIADKDTAVTEARQAAIDNAESQAVALAEAAGVTLGEIKNINSFSPGYPVPFMDGRGGGMMAVESAVPVSPGQMTITAEVNVVYIIE